MDHGLREQELRAYPASGLSLLCPKPQARRVARGAGCQRLSTVQSDLALCSALGAALSRKGGPWIPEGSKEWECEERAFSAAPAPPILAVSGGCSSVLKGVDVLTMYSPSFQGLLFSRSWVLPAQGCPDARKALRKRVRKADHSQLL